MQIRSYSALLLILTTVVAAAQELTLSVDGKTDYVIVTPKEPPPSVRRAAQELSRFLAEITGAEYQVVPESAPVQNREIVLGAPSRLARLGVTIDVRALGAEGYVLKTVGSSLAIGGSDVRGVMYGVYGLLEDHLGCRWFTPEVSRIPKRRTLRIPPLDETVVPVLEYRWPAVRDCYDADWCVRNRVNVGPKLRADHGGSVKFCGWAHTFEALVPVEKYYDKYPEYFALIDGKRLRGHTQLCCTNEEVVQIVIDGIRERMRTHPDATYFSVSQNDWGNYCQCEACQAVAAREESQMGPVLQLVNRVADAVADEFPDNRVTTLAYQWSRKPPKTIRPRPNVTVRLCTIECCFSHPFTRCDYAANVRFCEDIRGWSAICPNLWIWNYTTNFRNYYLPHPALKAINDDIQFFIAHNVKGVYEQDTKLTLNGDMSPLGGYIMAKFLWNPEYSEDTAIDEFLEAVYRAAAPHIRAYIDLLHDKVEKENIHLRCFTSTKAARFLTEEVLREADRLFALAEEAVKDRADVLRRVEVARLPVDYAIIERLGRNDVAPCKIDHATFIVEPLTNVSVNVERFLRRAKQAGVRTMSERWFPLAECEKTLATLRSRRLTPHKPSATDGVQPGIRVRYYEEERWPRTGGFSQLKPVTEMLRPQIDLAARKRNRMFGFVFEGLFRAPEDGVYTFHLRAEGGSELRVAGETIIDSKRATSSHSVRGHVALRKGWHPIRLRFREHQHNDGLDLKWDGPSVNMAHVSPEQLGHLPK